MPKKAIPAGLKKVIGQYVENLKKDNIPVFKVIIFGSYAKGKQHKWSDVDLCIISPQFTKPLESLHYLSLKTDHKAKYIIEPVGFTPDDLNNDYDTLIHEIKTNGIEIEV